MHDGSIATLDGVLDHYAAGGRTIASGPLAGNGSKNPNKVTWLNGFSLTAEQRKDMIAFLESLHPALIYVSASCPRMEPFCTLRRLARSRHSAGPYNTMCLRDSELAG